MILFNCVNYLLKYKPLETLGRILIYLFKLKPEDSAGINDVVNRYHPEVNFFDTLLYSFSFDGELSLIAYKIFNKNSMEEKMKEFRNFLQVLSAKNVFEFIPNLACLKRFPADYPKEFFSLDPKIRFIILLAVISQDDLYSFRYAVLQDMVILNHLQLDERRNRYVNLVLASTELGAFKIIEFLLGICPFKFIELV